MTDDSTPESADPAPSDSPSPGASLGSGHSILEEIGRRTGRVLRTTLHETEEDTTPVHDPRVESFQEQLRSVDRGKYNVVGEIASGGMGVVLRGHDTELGRDVAMKVVHAALANRPEVLERFVEEAQIGGQLQHPGIVPVYELGLMADERPYFTMKLVKGHTLAKLLSNRDGVDEDRVRFLSIFESVCQTVAYAHSKGVIHRDLKPANVMVGSFGEVQVVDWGLSKVMRRGGVADELASRDSALSVIETVRSGPQSGSGSMIGNVLGTPDYMPPEQARGEVEGLDERADVFALGAILCEILTGAPPYVERGEESLVELAAMGELDDARERIEACPAAEPLKKLCLKCLMPSKKARPASAERVANAVHAHLAGLEDAAHVAQLAAAEERVAAERSRRKHQLALSAAAILVVAAGGWTWFQGQQSKRLAELTRGFEDARELALDREREGAYDQAVDAANTGLRLLEAGNADEELLERARKLVVATEASQERSLEAAAEAARTERFLAFLTDADMRSVGLELMGSRDELDAGYRAAFDDFGIDIADPSIADRIEQLRDTPLAIEVARGADGWLRVLRQTHTTREDDIDLLNSIALDLDTDPVRAEIRLALAVDDRDAVRALATSVVLDDLPAETFALLNMALLQSLEWDLARWMATQGADRYPSHFQLQFLAGMQLTQKTGPGSSAFDPECSHSAQAYLRGALALRPDLPVTVMVLGDFYRSIGNFALSRRFSVQVAEAVPDFSWDWGTLGFDAYALGQYEAAVELVERRLEAFGAPWWQEMVLYRSRVIIGSWSLDDYVAWARENLAQDPRVGIGPALSLISSHTPGPDDPELALELLGPFLDSDGESHGGWMTAARAHVLLGDGEAAVAAVERGHRDADERDFLQRAIEDIVAAAAYRLLEDDKRADLRLASAQRIRDDLTAGREPEWERSILTEIFDQMLPIARGR